MMIQGSIMDINELTQKMDSFVQSKGWYRANSNRPQTPRNLAISISLEAAEILEHFQWSEGISNQEKLAMELADVTLYLLQLAAVPEIDLEKAVISKLAMNMKRTWDQE
jgi:NTP pyrophosphatase (non-canonical NTP hydrolase)